MRALLRTLLIWMLVLAVPAQTAAAATMARCGPMHHGQGSAATLGHHGGAAAQPAADGAGSPGHVMQHGAAHLAHQAHHAEAPSAAAEAASELADATATDSLAKAGAQKCSACASCCSAFALLGAVLLVPRAAPAATVFAALVASVVPFAADGPERPPRSALA